MDWSFGGFMLKKPGNILFIIFMLAVFLRLSGINHGFPYIFHPDEPTIVHSALGVRFNPNPGHFDWPHLYIYTNYIAYMLFAYLRNLLVSLDLKDTVSQALPLIWNDNLIFYLITRVFSALLGALTVIPVYLTGKKLFNDKVGLVAAFAYATFPFQVQHSHYTMPDTPMTFLLSWAIYYCAKILTEKDYANYALAGFFFGLSGSTKYNGLLAVWLVPLAHFFGIGYSKAFNEVNGKKTSFFNSLTLFIVSGFSCVLGFLLGTPYAALDYKTFTRTDGPSGALWQFTNVQSINLLQNLGAILKELIINVGGNLAYVALATLFICTIFLLYKIFARKFGGYDYSLSFLVIPAFILLFYVASHEKNRAQYYFIVYPYLAIIFSYFVNIVFSFIRRKSIFGSFIFLGVALFIPLFFASIVSIRYINNDTRLQLLKWGQGNLPVNSLIVFDSNEIERVIEDITINNLINSKVTPGTVYDYYISGEGKYPGKDFNEVYKIDNKYSLGPNIKVYKRGL